MLQRRMAPTSLQATGADQNHRADRISKKNIDVLRDSRTSSAISMETGKSDQDAGGQASLGSLHLNFAIDAEAIANHARKLIENFGEVAAGFFLNKERGDEETDVDDGNALGHD